MRKMHNDKELDARSFKLHVGALNTQEVGSFIFYGMKGKTGDYHMLRSFARFALRDGFVAAVIDWG